jgi:hypothetical protein
MESYYAYVLGACQLCLDVSINIGTSVNLTSEARVATNGVLPGSAKSVVFIKEASTMA